MKLNFGCGKEIKEGYINLDIKKNPGVDVVHDLDKYPYPFKDGTFDEVLCDRVLGLLENLVGAMEEIHRICKDGAKVIIRVPYYNSKASANDPLQKHHFNSTTFDFLTQNFETSHYTNARYKILKKTLVPTKFGKFFPSFIRERVSTVLGEVISTIWFELEVVKR